MTEECDCSSHHGASFKAAVGAFGRYRQPKVARATDGAAPNKRAKPFGFKRSPMTAKAETTRPQLETGREVDSLSSRFHQFSRLTRPFQTQHPVFLARQLMVVNKKFF